MCEILFIQGLFWVYIELWKTVKSEQQTGFKHLYTTTRINLQTTRDVLSLLQVSKNLLHISDSWQVFSVCETKSYPDTMLHMCLWFCSWGRGVFLSACWDTPPRRHLPKGDPQKETPRRRPPGRHQEDPQEDTRKTTPPGRHQEDHPSEQYMLGDTGNKRVVCILLECILFLIIISLHIHSIWETICDAVASWSGWKFGSKIRDCPL